MFGIDTPEFGVRTSIATVPRALPNIPGTLVPCVGLKDF
jgi:hypothetical protein